LLWHDCDLPRRRTKAALAAKARGAGPSLPLRRQVEQGAVS